MNTEQSAKPRFHWWPWSKRVLNRGDEKWCHTYSLGEKIPGTDFTRNWVEYEVTNHWTGSVTIKKEYLD